ncbi:glycosyltransferase family 2 protein [Algoriphagus kandeliae]|uniref:glycosyltransferase family 2 protein n=1 Tax=Algoriphagus kandeliae TaxID=2562278 RepID=UPI0013872A5C|nr:glycosyltransferase family 2 protein [Algoriphagus kandeliae]
MDLKKPQVSILIPNYNKAPYIQETLDSVLAQTYTDWECIIVDDHSTDNSWEILENYAEKDSRFKIYRRPGHLPKGGNVCRNFAFELSKGEFIQWFDSDDLMYNSFLKERLNYISNPEIDFSVFIQESKFYNKEKKNRKKDIIHDFLMLRAVWSGPSMIIKRSFLVKNKLSWIPELTYFQDIYYSIYLINLGRFELNFINDWEWRSITLDHLGYKSDMINDFLINKSQISIHFKALRYLCNGDVLNFYFNWYCYRRVWDIYRLNIDNKQSPYPLFSYLIAPIQFRTISLFEGVFILLFGFISFLFNKINKRISLSFLFRATKKHHSLKVSKI